MPFEDLIQEIEGQERWLAGLAVEVAPPEDALERTRQVVRLAIDEAWLGDRVEAEPSSGVLASVKRAVARELAAASAEAAPAPTGLAASQVLALSRSVAAAACLVMAAGLGFWSAVSAPDRFVSSDELDDLVAVMSRETDDEEAEWDVIEVEMAALETALTQGVSSSWDRALLDDLDDEIDALMYDLDLWPEGVNETG